MVDSHRHSAATLAVLFSLAAVPPPAPVAGQLAMSAAAAGTAPSGSRSDSARAVHLLSRATWGVRAGDIEAVLGAGREAWLDRQLDPAGIPDDAAASRLAAFPLSQAPPAELYRDLSPQRAPQMQAARDSLGDDTMQAMTTGQSAARRQRNPARILTDLIGAKLQRAVYSERQLEDVMADFWFNHFNVFFNKGQDRYLVGDYERNAIRPHVFGRFEDMLTATAQHPAMLFYLDNWRSVYVDTLRLAQRTRGQMTAQQLAQARSRGLNENYARELLELHTLGVDGGYAQQDVIEVARAFTGWTFDPRAVAAGDGAFTFRPALHDGGAKVVLGESLPAGRGEEDGLDVIRLLSRHPATARHIATKLVERFVADEAPADLIEHVAAVFLATDGDLRAVTRALFTADAFYRDEHRAAKVKTPFALVASALRATGAEVLPSRTLAQTLRSMGHAPFTASEPTGFPAMSADWVNTGAMLNRMNFGLDLAAGRVDGVRVDLRALAGGNAGGVGPVEGLLATVLPGVDSSVLAGRIRQDIAAQSAGQVTPRPREVAARALGLALGSPEFQRH